MGTKPFVSEPELTSTRSAEEDAHSLCHVARWALAWSEDLRREAKQLNSTSHAVYIEPPIVTTDATPNSPDIEPMLG
jgi:hypothetical protein